MFLQLLRLRLIVVDSLNNTPEADQEATARAWVDIYELEASRLIEGAAEWMPAHANHPTAFRRRHAQQWGRLLGYADARLALIVADQACAALIRGHLDTPDALTT